MKVLDLCSGLGGFSQAFIEAGHEVLRIDNNPLLSNVDNTKIMCIFEFRDWLEEYLCINPQDIDVVLFSPPCYEFSLAFGAPRAIHSRESPGIPYKPSLDVFDCGLDIIRLLKPKHWILENVRGASPWFSEVLGKPRQINEAYFFWGNFPSFVPGAFPSKAEKDERRNPLRANIRGQIPMEISTTLLEAIENQKSIFDYV